MKKNIKRGIIVVSILFVVFNVLCFAIPFEHKAPFWLAYLFGSISILVQLPLLYSAFCKENTPKSRFYGFPISQIGLFYLIAQIVLSFLTMLLQALLPVWFIVILYVIVLAVAAIGFVGVDAMRDEVERQENNVAKNINVMRSLQSKANVLNGLCSDPELSKVVNSLAEELKYSDPISNEHTIAFENDLLDILEELKRSLTALDKDKALVLCKKAKLVLEERNRICKANK